MNADQKDEVEIPEDEVRDDADIGRAFRLSLLFFIGFGLLASGTWYLLREQDIAEPTQETKVQSISERESPPVQIPRVYFTDITQEAGIDFVHENGAAGGKLLPETMGGGCAFWDFDNDGDQDLFLTNSSGWPWNRTGDETKSQQALYENDGAGNFTNVTEGSGLDITCYGMGVAIGDYDNDGLDDLYLTAVGSNYLFHNEGNGQFKDVTESAGVAGGKNDWGTSCGWFDYNNDGLLDLFVCNYLEWSPAYDEAQNFQLTGGGRAYGRPQDFSGTFCTLYRNEGNGAFVDVSEEAGIQVRNPATDVPVGKSLGVTFHDFNRDGWMDIIVANDTVQNFLFKNLGNGTFQEEGAVSGVAFDSMGNARGAMGIDIANFRNTEAVGIAIGNFSNEMAALYVAYNNEMMFTDEAIASGLGPNTRLNLTFGMFYFDYDLNGLQDLLAANGHLEEEINRVQPSQAYEQSPQLFWNCGPQYGTEFLPVNEEKCGPELLRPLVGRGASYADIDNDGDLDVLIAAVGQAPRLLRNDLDAGHHWLRVKLEGTTSNRSAIGATLTLHTGEQKLTRMVMPTKSYLSQSERPVTFGLGTSDRIDELIIQWPDGQTQTLKDVAVDETLTVQQPENSGNETANASL